jgi:hypothetical protein
MNHSTATADSHTHIKIVALAFIAASARAAIALKLGQPAWQTMGSSSRRANPLNLRNAQGSRFADPDLPKSAFSSMIMFVLCRHSDIGSTGNRSTLVRANRETMRLGLRYPESKYSAPRIFWFRISPIADLVQSVGRYILAPRDAVGNRRPKIGTGSGDLNS